jgi:selenocysteine lyase/cysteine desulfurase
VILWDTSYGSLKKMAHQYCQHRVTEIPVSDYFCQWWNDSSESSSDVFEHAFLETLQKIKNESNHQKVENALLILDHTTSNTALSVPIAKLSKLAKEMGMLVMVDGAHGLFSQNLALNEEELPHVDFYVGNGHKWLSCPRGIGFLYCPHACLRDSILKQPAVISHGIEQGFQSRFLWDGCRDYAAALSVPAVLDHWEHRIKVDGGIVRFRNEMNARLREAINLLSQSWHENEEWERSLLAPLVHHSPMMALVRLPDAVQPSPSTSAHAKAVQDFLYDNLIEVPIKCVRGVLYVRISCHVYNEIHEYQRLADVMLKFPGTRWP